MLGRIGWSEHLAEYVEGPGEGQALEGTGEVQALEGTGEVQALEGAVSELQTPVISILFRVDYSVTVHTGIQERGDEDCDKQGI